MALASPSYRKFATRLRAPDPESAALLVIDMQLYFSDIAAPILPAIAATISTCRSAGIPIIFTRHSHPDSESSRKSMLGEWWSGDLIFDGTPESALLMQIDRRDDDIVVEKKTYSGFYETNLEGILKGLGRKEVIVTGVMTNLCCETTAREAFVRGFRVFFSADATATARKEMHEATLMNLGYGFAYLVDSEGLKKANLGVI